MQGPAHPEGWGTSVRSFQNPPLMAHGVHDLGKLQAAPCPLACRQGPQYLGLPRPPLTPQIDFEVSLSKTLSCLLACRLEPLPSRLPRSAQGFPSTIGCTRQLGRPLTTTHIGLHTKDAPKLKRSCRGPSASEAARFILRAPVDNSAEGSTPNCRDPAPPGRCMIIIWLPEKRGCPWAAPACAQTMRHGT